MSNATKIDVYLKSPNGDPLGNTRFIIKPVRAGFWSTNIGLTEDKELVYQTDLNGYVQMTLMPLPYPYILTYSFDDDSVPGHFLFYVPAVDTVVQLQDLIVTRADSTDKYADDILRQIIEAKVATLAAASDAKAAELLAEAASKRAEDAAGTAESDAKRTEDDRKQVTVTNQQLIDIYVSIVEAITKVQSINLLNMLKLGSYFIWVDNAGRLRIDDTKPVDKNTDGTIVGTQS